MGPTFKASMMRRSLLASRNRSRGICTSCSRCVPPFQVSNANPKLPTAPLPRSVRVGEKALKKRQQDQLVRSLVQHRGTQRILISTIAPTPARRSSTDASSTGSETGHRKRCCRSLQTSQHPGLQQRGTSGSSVLSMFLGTALAVLQRCAYEASMQIGDDTFTGLVPCAQRWLLHFFRGLALSAQLRPEAAALELARTRSPEWEVGHSVQSMCAALTEDALRHQKLSETIVAFHQQVAIIQHGTLRRPTLAYLQANQRLCDAN